MQEANYSSTLDTFLSKNKIRTLLKHMTDSCQRSNQLQVKYSRNIQNETL